MKRAMTTVCCLLVLGCFQAQDSLFTDTLNQAQGRPLWFGSEGFVDFSTIGAWNTSAQLMRFWIGEPDVFRVPLLIFAGATNLPFSQDELNSATVYDLVNPVGGNISVAFDFCSKPFLESNSGSTVLAWNLFGAVKLLRGQSLEYQTGQSDLGYFLEAGVTFQTAAGLSAMPNTEGGGRAYFALRYAVTQLDGNTMESLFDSSTSPHGLRFEMGVLVKDRINLRLSYFKTFVGKDLPNLDKAQWRFGMDYLLAG